MTPKSKAKVEGKSQAKSKPKVKRRVDDQVILDRHNLELDEVREFFKKGGPEDWREEASCRGVETNKFFPGMGEPTAPAQAVCANCPVKKICLLDALRTKEAFGVWGGASERERRRIRSVLARNDIHATAPATRSLDAVVDRIREANKGAEHPDTPIFREPRVVPGARRAQRIA